MRYFYNEEGDTILAISNTGTVTIFSPMDENNNHPKGREEGYLPPPVSPETASPSPEDAEDKGKPDAGTRRPFTRRIKAKKEIKKKGNKCANCGERGHYKKTCKFSGPVDGPSENASEAIDKMRFTPITPDKLHKIKSMLAAGDPISHIAEEVGVGEERVERMKEQLGL